MIILEAQSSATIVGDVQSNAVGVNARDLDFITMILSTKLYSKPLESFLREIVSNAWDSHVEAGVKDPILLEIGTDTEGRDYCRIQDFGVGLSPERFETIYKMMGSSTKRDSDDQIGGFGIGRFSSLAYSDTVHLTSNHDGIKYKYLMYKDGNKIKIDELFNTPTTDPNGFEVMVYFKSQSDGRNFQDAIRSQLIYFENLYISADRYEGGLGMREFAKEFNELRIKKYKTFSVNTFDRSQKTSLCIGKIRYPLNKFSVPNTHFNFDADYPIVVNFEIGELLVTPNREEIQYDDATIKVIEKKLNDVQDEINDMINLEKVRDYDDLEKYVDALEESHILINLYEDDRSRIYFRHRDKSNMKVTYKGEFYKPVITSMFKYINYDASIVTPDDYDFKVEGGKLTRVNIGRRLDISEVVSKIRRGSICIGKQSDLNIVSKEYLRQSSQSITFINNMNWKDTAKRMFKLLNNRFKATSYSHSEYDSKGAKIVIKDALSKLKDIETFTNDSVPQDFIDKREALKKAKRAANITDSVNWNEEVNLFILQESNRYNDDTNIAVTTVSERVALESLRTKWNKFPVIYSFKGDPLVRELFWVFTNIRNKSYLKYKFVEIAPTKMDTLKQFPNFINVLDYMNVEYKKIRAIATAQYITTHYPHIEDLHSVQYDLANISTVLQEVVVKVQDYVNNNTLITYYSGKPEILDEIGQLCAKHDYYDTEMMGYLKEHDTLLTNSRFITLFKDSRNILKGTYNIIVDYALTKKLFRPNVEAVKKLRSETIFNIKKKKMKLIKTQKTLTVVFENGDIISHENCTDEMFEDVMAFRDDEDCVRELLLPEFKNKVAIAESKKDLLDGIEISEYLVKRGSSVYIPSVSELSVPEDLVNKILAAELEGDEELVNSYLNFWTLTSINPDSRVRQNLFWFLDKYGMTISKSGLFVAYRNVMVKNKDSIISPKLAEAISSKYIHIKFKQQRVPSDYNLYFDNDANEYVALTETYYDNLVEEYEDYDLEKDFEDDEDEDEEYDYSDEVQHPDDYLTYKGNLDELYNRLSESPEAPIYTDAHTRSFTIKIGEVVSMDRKKCDSNQDNTCSSGLHVAGQNWLERNYFGDTGMMVLVNPTDVVAVPPQDGYGKMRTAAYYPVGIVKWDDSGKIVFQDIEDGFEDDFMEKICYNGERNSNDDYPYMVNIPEIPEIDKSKINARLIEMASGLNKVIH